jgi:hypothetical protein
MPTTLTGLLLFVVLLLPGFVYLVGKERAGTERRTSPFRETVAVVAASVASELFVVCLSWYLWSRTLDVESLVRDPGVYWQERPGLLAGWGLGLLLAATLIAHLATRPQVRRWLPGKYPHPSTVSAWWVLFETWKRGRYVYAGCVLDDGSYVAGTVECFNISADDDTARDLILSEPIEYRQPNGKTTEPLHCQAVCVPANRIVMIETSYVTRRRTSAELAAARAVVVARGGDPALMEPTRPASDPASRSAVDPVSEVVGPHQRAVDPSVQVRPQLVRDAARASSPDHPGSPSSSERVDSAPPLACGHGYDRPRQPPTQVGRAPGPHHRPLGQVSQVDATSVGEDFITGGR